MATVLVCTLEMGKLRGEQRDWALALVQDGRHELTFTRGMRRNPVSANRNEVARAVRRRGDLDYLLTVDEDVVPPARVLDYVDLDLDVVVFPCHIWQANHNPDHPVVLNVALDEAPVRWVDGRQGLLEISRAGAGAMLIARRVFEHPAMMAPFSHQFDDDGLVAIGEDMSFCDRARAAGFRIWAAMDCVCSHYKTVDLAEVSQLLRRKAILEGAFVAPRKALDGKRLVFCLSPGRCGTRYLAALMRTIPNVLAFHEPLPNFVEAMQYVQEHDERAYGFWLERKLPAILAMMDGQGADGPACSTYVETSHLFGQGFFEPLLKLGILPDAIVLGRPAREMALSRWWREAVPGRTRMGDLYLLPAPEGTEGWTDYQLCYWFVREMERRSRRYAGMLRRAGALVYELTLADLATREGFGHLAAYLKLGEPNWEAYERVAGERVNATPPARRERRPEGDLDAQEREVDLWLER